MPELEVCIAIPAAVPEALWDELEASLDNEEQSRKTRLRVDADRRSYVLAHGLRRAFLARRLCAPPRSLRFAADSNGKPELVTPVAPTLFFSHSRNRHAVALAISECGPVGIDLEYAQAGNADFTLLDPYVEQTGMDGQRSDREFCLYWTALEAFWKSRGTGLASGSPRIRCQRTDAGTIEVTTAADEHTATQARGFTFDAAPGCVATVVLRSAPDPVPIKLVNCSSPFGYLRLFRAESAPEK